MRRFPAPWTIEALDGGGFKVVDANKQGLAYVYGHADVRAAEIAKGLTLDEARAHSGKHRQVAKLAELEADASSGAMSPSSRRTGPSFYAATRSPQT
jgi:hypothetical protein